MRSNQTSWHSRSSTCATIATALVAAVAAAGCGSSAAAQQETVEGANSTAAGQERLAKLSNARTALDQILGASNDSYQYVVRAGSLHGFASKTEIVVQGGRAVQRTVETFRMVGGEFQTDSFSAENCPDVGRIEGCAPGAPTRNCTPSAGSKC